MDNTTPSLSPQGLNAIRMSLSTLTTVCSQLIAILDRSPEQVSTYAVGIAHKLQKADNFLLVDKVVRMIGLMEKHLDHILDALHTHSLYDNTYKATYGHTSTLVEALQEKRDVICQKRREDGFLDNTFGYPLDEIGKKIHTIYKKIPLYTQKAA